MNIKALIIDDDIKLQELLKEYFESYEISVSSHFTGLDVTEVIKDINPEIIILDIMLPGKDGLEVLKEIRTTFEIPVIMLTARGDDMDRIVGLELGADDYLAKPFNTRELVARIKAILRRKTVSKPTEEKIKEDSNFDLLIRDSLTLDRSRHLIIKDDKKEELSATEFKLLEAMMRRPNMIFSRDDLLDIASGRELLAFDRSIDMHISKLRNKLEKISDSKDRIKTSWGTGYKFVSYD